MPVRNPVTQADRDRVAELHAEGKSRNDIADLMDRSGSTISGIARKLGLTFERGPEVASATAARQADLEERRQLLATRFIDIAEDSLDRIYQETTVYSFGGKNNDYNDHTFPEAPIAERVKLMTAAAIAVDKSLKLAPAESNAGLDAAKSMLGSLGAALSEYVRAEDETADQGDGEA
ncbi:helix-turn-helix domain-containing protein [Streptomyces sp. 4R-3d]|uniref:helix-turn-helix domain-containing protein n=1 Tax=Streptomyces sp. 4R-3d TaxID=2559605 RepID=UPI0010718777|nr:helix-turn-helix domain-containing protein [Streptomyces sp. 4R-3d]TFI30156.1 helix-turn-helix domain-containing protein [Streptomyces sp. 4R-3d]